MKFGTRTLLIVTAVAAAIVGVLLPALQNARDAAMEMSCGNNIKWIGLGLLNFEDTHRHFPLAVEVTEDGRLWRSWRTHVYPSYIEQSAPAYDASSAWDSQTNLRVINGTPIAMGSKDGTVTMRTLERVPPCFACPKRDSSPNNGVNYVVVRGDLTAFPTAVPARLSDITDGLENTILVVESITCTPEWTEPRDLDFDTMQFAINSRDGPSISSLHPTGALVCFADCQVYCITPSVTASELKAMLTIAGNEDIEREDLVARGVLIKR